MRLLPMMLRRWYVAFPLVALVGLAAFVVDRSAPSSYGAEGVVMVADPEVDPTRSALRGIDVANIASEVSSPSARSAIVSAGGNADYSVSVIGPRRVQVLTTGGLTEGTSTVEAVLSHLERIIDRDQEESGRALGERMRSQLLIDVSPEEPVSGSAAPSRYQVTGTLLLEDPPEEGANPFSAENATRLLTATLTSESERDRVKSQLGEGFGYHIADYDRRAPGMLRISVAGPDEAKTLRAFATVVEIVDDELEARQATAAVPVNRRRFIEVLAEPQEAFDRSPSLSLPALVTLLGGLLLAVGGTAALDARLRMRHASGGVESFVRRARHRVPRYTSSERSGPVVDAGSASTRAPFSAPYNLARTDHSTQSDRLEQHSR